jgi:PHYB activation tagged suppressor 1
MNEQFQRLTIDIIAHTAFGSSYVQGKEAFKEKKKTSKMLCCFKY